MHKILQLCGALVAILGSQAVVPVSLVILCMFFGVICATIRKHRVIQYLLYVGLKRNRRKKICCQMIYVVELPCCLPWMPSKSHTKCSPALLHSVHCWCLVINHTVRGNRRITNPKHIYQDKTQQTTLLPLVLHH